MEEVDFLDLQFSGMGTCIYTHGEKFICKLYIFL